MKWHFQLVKARFGEIKILKNNQHIISKVNIETRLNCIPELILNTSTVFPKALKILLMPKKQLTVTRRIMIVFDKLEFKYSLGIKAESFTAKIKKIATMGKRIPLIA